MGNQTPTNSLHKPRRPKRAAAAAVTSYDEDGLSGDLSQDDIADINALELEEGDVMVHRAPILACLEVPPEVVLKRPFKPPIPAGWIMPPEECGLGSFNKGRKSLGMSNVRRPPSSLGAYRSVSKEELAAVMEDEEAVPGYEPCILWEPAEEENQPTNVSGAVSSKPRPVIVSPFIGKFLREHQREGVRFVFECVCGLRPYNGQGCILADDMGLGKTLQSITLLYTLLRKGVEGKPTCRRVIVVTPTSLVRNWDNELTKWLNGRVRSIALAESDRKKAIKSIRRFVAGAYEVMIISYETFRIHSALFEGEDVCDLLICDEAHRLKNDATLTAQALDKLQCKRRILLSGTPMQNDLEEFYAMVNFCNPGILGTVNEFRKLYQNPILAGREPDATEAQVKKSTERSAQLSEIVNHFILRRTNTLLAKHLPPKLTQIVCVPMTDMQRLMYEQVISMAKLPDDGPKRGKEFGATALNAINAMKKICNHPQLMYKPDTKYKEKKASGPSGEDQIMDNLRHFFPENFGSGSAGMRSSRRLHGGPQEDFDDGSGATMHSSNIDWSGKFMLLANMLDVMRKETDERIVIVSNYTQTLDLIGILCNERNYPFVRLDGGTPAKKRQALVDRLNNPKDDVFVFLLSSKAGGCGLNLVGANRLILFDPDWNPATDKQAAARVWRDGAKKRCYVYRFVATGTIEEKIYQRQLSKEGLQSVIADDKDIESMLSTAQLKEIFTYRHGLVSDTHDLYKCERCDKEKYERYKQLRRELGDPVSAFKRGVRGIVDDNDEDQDRNKTLQQSPVPEPGSRVVGFSAPRRAPPKAAPQPVPPSNSGGNSVIPQRDFAVVPKDCAQIETPDEGDLNEWSHHMGVESCDDYVFRKAAGCLVSFVFGQVLDGDGLARMAQLKALKAQRMMEQKAQQQLKEEDATRATAAQKKVKMDGSDSTIGGTGSEMPDTGSSSSEEEDSHDDDKEGGFEDEEQK